MEKKATFGNAELAQRIGARFGADEELIKAEMRFGKEVSSFITKVEEAKKKAAGSKLVFG